MEQLQLQLKCELQSRHCCNHALDALVDPLQIVNVGVAQLCCLFDLLMLRFKDTRQSLLLLCDSLNQLGDGFAAAVLTG